MTRIAIQLDENEDAYRAAASRIHDAQVVGVSDSPDVLVSSEDVGSPANIPMLAITPGSPLVSEYAYPALPWRFQPDVQAVRQSLTLGNLGTPGLLRLHSWASQCSPGGRRSRIAAVDLALWFFEAQPNSIHSISHPEGPQVFHLGFPKGGMAILDFTDQMPEGEAYQSFCLIGSDGAAYADDHGNRNLFFSGGPPGASPPDFRFNYIQAMLEEFLENIRSGTNAISAKETYNNAVRVTEQALQQS
jgi:hypothetical protein